MQPFRPFLPFPPSAIHVPTPEEIANSAGPNSNYQGMSMTSTNNLVRDKDGNLVRQGQTVVVTNNNGKVVKYDCKY